MSLTVGVSSNVIDTGDGIGHYTVQLLKYLELADVKTKQYRFESLRKTRRLEHYYPFLVARGVLTKGKFFRTDISVDLFHSTDFMIVPMKCPVIATIWDAIPFAHPEWVSNALKSRMILQLIRQSAQFADRVIAASHHAAGDIIKYFKVDEDDITIIPGAIDDFWYEEISKDKITEVLKKYGLNEEGYFLTVGTLQPRKNFERLIDAYMALPDAIRKERKLVIVGKYGWQSEQTLKKIQTAAPSNQVVWLSNVTSDDDLRHIYRGAGIFVFPSLHEGFGLPVVEAFASGLPVVLSNATSLPEISKNAAIEVNPFSISELTDAMQLLATSPLEQEKRKKLGYLRASEYRWEKIMPRLIELYKSQL